MEPVERGNSGLLSISSPLFVGRRRMHRSRTRSVWDHGVRQGTVRMATPFPHIGSWCSLGFCEKLSESVATNRYNPSCNIRRDPSVRSSRMVRRLQDDDVPASMEPRAWWKPWHQPRRSAIGGICAEVGSRPYQKMIAPSHAHQAFPLTQVTGPKFMHILLTQAYRVPRVFWKRVS